MTGTSSLMAASRPLRRANRQLPVPSPTLRSLEHTCQQCATIPPYSLQSHHDLMSPRRKTLLIAPLLNNPQVAANTYPLIFPYSNTRSADATSQNDVLGRVPDHFLPSPANATNALSIPSFSVPPQHPEGSVRVASHQPSRASRTVALFETPTQAQDQTGIQITRRLEDNPAYRPISGPSIRLNNVAAPSGASRRATLRREGAFHEHDRPYWNSGSGYEPPEVRGRAAAAMPENRK